MRIRIKWNKWKTRSHKDVMIEAITICVNYADYLDLTLPENKSFFDNYIVVTSHSDKDTVNICNKYGVQVVQTDDFYKDASFRKGAGINVGLSHIVYSDWVALIDADILMGENTGSIIHNVENLNKRYVYGPVNKFHSTTNIVGSNAHWGGKACAGFFQLFNVSIFQGQQRYHPCGSKDCSEDDIKFSRLFDKVEYVDITAIHLGPTSEDGKPNVNWKGRKSGQCPYSPIDIKRMKYAE